MRKFLKKILKYFGFRISKLNQNPLQDENPLNAIKKALQDQNDIILFDVGANLGQTLRKMRKEFPLSKIYAFEPSRGCFTILKNEFNCRNTYIYNCAVGAIDGKINFNEYSWSALNSILKRAFGSAKIVDTYIVDLISIDSFCKNNKIKKIHFLKTDTEGYEL